MKQYIYIILIVLSTIRCSRFRTDQDYTAVSYMIENQTDTMILVEFGPKLYSTNQNKFYIEQGQRVVVVHSTPLSRTGPSIYKYKYAYLYYKKYIFKDTASSNVANSILNIHSYKKSPIFIDKKGFKYMSCIFTIDEVFINKKIEEQKAQKMEE